MNQIVKVMCFIGGANLDILQKCPTEKNGFIATGIGIINVILLSLLSMIILVQSKLQTHLVFTLLISIFYSFFVFIGYWGVLSVLRKSVKYSSSIKFLCVASAVLFSFVASNVIEVFIIKDYSLLLKPNFLANKFNYYFITLIIDFIVALIYILPVIIKILIKSSNYEEEKEKMELNFLAEKEADIIAYKEKYQSYAKSFSESDIKMNLIEQLYSLTKEYHSVLGKTLKETFEFKDKITKIHDKDSQLLSDSQNEIEKQFKTTISKMSNIFEKI